MRPIDNNLTVNSHHSRQSSPMPISEQIVSTIARLRCLRLSIHVDPTMDSKAASEHADACKATRSLADVLYDVLTVLQ